MKLTHYFLALYTVLLSCIPCQDDLLISSHDTTRETVSVLQDETQTQSPDLCSPFCICSCCAGVTILQHVAHLPEMQPVHFLKENSFAYTSQVKSSDLNTVWQPPRI